MSAEETTEQKSAETDATPAGEAAIVAAIGMSSLLVSFLTSLKSTVTEFFSDMKASLENVIDSREHSTDRRSEGKRRSQRHRFFDKTTSCGHGATNS